MRLLVTVTFNPNQLRAHLEPLADLPEVDEILLVADMRPPPLAKVRTVVPPRVARRLLGRAVAKLLACIVMARRTRPDWVIGFNLVPHGLNAIVAARMCGARSMYVMIGGPTEWEEGGWRSDNKVLGRLRRPSRTLEWLLLRVVRGASAIVTMGETGRDALVQHGVAPSRVTIIPASVDGDRFTPGDGAPQWDCITVAELIPRKRLHDLVDAVAALKIDRPAIRAAIVGTGPLEQALKERASQLGVTAHIEFLGFRDDIAALYRRARIFVLPSQFEGLSISLLEAMAAGLPPVASDVGDVRDVVVDGTNGFIYTPGDVRALTSGLARLLDDGELCLGLGRAAREDCLRHAGRRAVSEKYARLLDPAAACRYPATHATSERAESTE